MKKAIISSDMHNERVYNQISPKATLALLECTDHRRFGPDLLDMCYTTFGGVDAFVHGCKTLSAVHASGIGMLQEDCVVTGRDGKPIDVPLKVDANMDVVAAGTRKLHSQLLAALRK